MNKMLISGASLLAMTVTALAADMPSYPPPQEAVVVDPVYDWSGAYVGIHGGWAWGESELLGTTVFEDVEGFVIGGHVGYNWQVNSIVFGLEADGSYTDQEVTVGDFFAETDFLASIRGRLGFGLDRFLIYGTGGAAFTGVNYGFDTFEDDVDYFGWVAGGGIEYAITDNITFGVEYLHYDFSGEDVVFDDDPGIDSEMTTDVVRGRLSIKFDSLFQ